MLDIGKFTMKRLAQDQIGILSGEELLFSDFENNGQMWSGDGEREVRTNVSFETAFSAAPSVMVNMAMIDMSHDTNFRADLRAENITQLGFDIVFRTWDNTRVARLRATWQAIGPVVTEDGWDE